MRSLSYFGIVWITYWAFFWDYSIFVKTFRGFFPKAKTIKLVVIVLLLWSFAIMAGLSASILRAVTMFTFRSLRALLKQTYG